MSAYVLGLDAGGTSTKCWVVERDGTVAGVATGGPGNHVLGAMETVRVSFSSATRDALAAAGVDAEQVTAAVAGCSGIEAAGETRAPVEQLLNELFPRVALRHAVGDMIVAFHGALPAGVGVVVLAGTGATVYGRNEDGQGLQVDGWGHLIGDAGSAYAIGREALRRAAAAQDGRGPDTHLTDTLPAALGHDSLREAAYAVYDHPHPRELVAGLARDVAEAAAAGDAVAEAILADAGWALGGSAVAALRRLGLDCGPADVATAGSVFNAGRALTDAFAAAVRERAPDARVVRPALPPVGGAAKLAWEAAGVTWGPEQVARAQATQPA